MFFGSDRAFVERIPKTYRNLSDIAMQMDDENKQMQLVLVGLPGNENAPSKTKKSKIKVNNFIIFADEYSSVNEHVIINFFKLYLKIIYNKYVYSKSADSFTRTNKACIRRLKYNRRNSSKIQYGHGENN